LTRGGEVKKKKVGVNWLFRREKEKRWERTAGENNLSTEVASGGFQIQKGWGIGKKKKREGVGG